MSQKCGGCTVPHLQQLLGRIKRTGEGISGLQTYQLSRPLALGHLKHATLEILHLPLMKMREIKFLASIPAQKKLSGWIVCRLGFESLENMKVCENKNSNYRLVQALCKMCAASFCWWGCVYTSLLYNYYITMFLSCSYFKKKNNVSTHNTVRLMSKGKNLYLWTAFFSSNWKGDKKSLFIACVVYIRLPARHIQWVCHTLVFAAILWGR